MDAKKRAASPPVDDARRTRARTDSVALERPLLVAKHLECSICMALFHDPVTLSSGGQTFDLDCVLAHIAQDKTTCPMSRADLKINPYATPSAVIRGMVAEYIDNHPGAGELTPRHSFEPIHLLDPKIRKQAELKSLVKRLQEAVEVEVHEDMLDKLSDKTDDEAAVQILAAIPDALALVVRFLSSESENCRYSATSALASIARVAECRSLIARTPDAFIKLKSLLAPSEPDRVRTAAARAIGNATCGEEARRLVLDVPDLIWSIAQCLSSENDYIFDMSVYALGNLACDNDFQVSILRLQGVLPNLVRGMRHGTVKVRQHSSFAICYLAHHARNMQMIANHPDVLTLLVQRLRDDDEDVRWHASGALAHLATDHDSIRTAIAAIPDTLTLLIQLERTDPSEKVRKDAKWALANLSLNPEIKTTIEQLKEQQQQ